MVGTRISLREQAVREAVTSWLVTASESFVVTGSMASVSPTSSRVPHLALTKFLSADWRGGFTPVHGEHAMVPSHASHTPGRAGPRRLGPMGGVLHSLGICGAFGPGFACLQAGAGGRCVEGGACMVKPGCWSAYTPPPGAQVDDVL